MNAKIKLAGSLSRLFGLLRYALILGLLWCLFSTVLHPWVKPLVGVHIFESVKVSDIALTLDQPRIALRTDQTNPGDLELGALKGTLTVNRNTADKHLIAMIDWVFLPLTLLSFAFYYTLFGNLRAICSRIEEGEVFVEKNLRMIRNVGVLMIGYAILRQATEFITITILGSYLHYQVTGAEMQARIDLAGSLNFGVGANAAGANILTGVVVMLIGEVFRQGLLLKTENELTI